MALIFFVVFLSSNRSEHHFFNLGFALSYFVCSFVVFLNLENDDEPMEQVWQRLTCFGSWKLCPIEFNDLPSGLDVEADVNGWLYGNICRTSP